MKNNNIININTNYTRSINKLCKSVHSKYKYKKNKLIHNGYCVFTFDKPFYNKEDETRIL